MSNLAVMIALVGSFWGMLVIAALFLMKHLAGRERVRSADASKFHSYTEQILREHAEMKKDLQTVKETVEAIDGMMKDI